MNNEKMLVEHCKKGEIRYRTTLNNMFKITLLVSLQMTLVFGLQLMDNLLLGHLDNSTYITSASNAIINATYIIFSIISAIGIHLMKFATKKNLNNQKEIFKIKLAYLCLLASIFILPSSIFIKHLSHMGIDSNNNLSVDFAAKYGMIVIPSLFWGLVTLVFASTFKQTRIMKMTIIISSIALKKLLTIFPKCSIWTLNSFLLSFGLTIRMIILSRISVELGGSLNSVGVSLCDWWLVLLVGLTLVFVAPSIHFLNDRWIYTIAMSHNLLKLFDLFKCTLNILKNKKNVKLKI